MIIFLDIETISELRNKEIEEKYGDRLNFMPEFNQIFTICLGTMTNEGTVVKNLLGSEQEQITKFFEVIKGNHICGFNIKKFDIPFIIKRALKYKIKIPNDLQIFWKKPWETNNIFDLQEVYGYGIFGNIGNLDLCCNFLGVTSPKDGISGSQVQEFYNNGKQDEIIEYCKRDVKATIELYNYFLEYNLF